MWTASHQLGLGCLPSLRNGPPVGFSLHQEGWSKVSLERCELCLKCDSWVRGSVSVHGIVDPREAWGRPGAHGFPGATIWKYIPSVVSVPSLHNGTNHSHLTEWAWTPSWWQSIHSPLTGIEMFPYRRATANLLLTRFTYKWDTQSET